MTDNRLRRRLVKCIHDTRLKVLEVEAFWISPDFDIEFVKPAIETAALLEAKFILIVGNDPDLSRFQINFSRLSELVRSHHMRVALEFISFVAVNNLEMALKTIHLSALEKLKLARQAALDVLKKAQSVLTTSQL